MGRGRSQATQSGQILDPRGLLDAVVGMRLSRSAHAYQQKNFRLQVVGTRSRKAVHTNNGEKSHARSQAAPSGQTDLPEAQYEESNLTHSSSPFSRFHHQWTGKKIPFKGYGWCYR